jgi:ABC-type glycerol-3-phosphate transport system substrate-binding protein
MQNKYLRLILLASLVLVLTLCITACSPEQNDTGTNDIAQPPQQNNASISENQDTSDSTNEASPAESTLSGTLTISQASRGQLERAVERFTTLHPDVEIVLNCYDSNWQRFNMQVSTELMAGVADDIISLGTLPLFDLADRGLVVDLLPLMQNDPDFNEDDYFMHVIDSFKYRSGLHVFPMQFDYTLIGINTFNLDEVSGRNPEEIIERFRQLETISYRQMLDLYIGLENRDGLYVSLAANALDHIISSLSIFIDFENNIANFYSDEFIRTLNDWREVTDPLLIAGGRLPISRSGSFTGVNRAAQIERASRYLFAAYGMGLSYDVFFPHTEQELFTHFIPLATCDGEILVHTGRAFFINSASYNVELAWEFLKFLATDMYVYNRFPTGIPTNRDKFRNTISHSISNAIGVWTREERLFDVGDIDELTESIYEKVSVFNEMPMRHSTEYWGAHSVMMSEIITSFYHGVLTAEQAALELQNRISIFLMERE